MHNDVQDNDCQKKALLKELHEKAEAHVRSYAEEQLKVSPVLTYNQRQWIAQGMGCALYLFIALKWPTVVGYVTALGIGCLASLIAEAVLAELFPTPPIRIARVANELAVSVTFWPVGSNEFRDYVSGYARHLRRRKRQRWLRRWLH